MHSYTLLPLAPGIVLAYWDLGSCGPNGDNANWNWCGKRGGGACKESVKTRKCPSGTASLKQIFGNQHATEDDVLFEYHLNGCKYAYYAIYACTGKSF